MIAVFHAFMWFVDHLETLCTVIGMFAVAIPAVDQWIRRKLAARPDSRFWKLADRMFFGSGNALANIGYALDKMLAKRREIRGS